MTILYLTEHDTKSYGVKIEVDEVVIVQKYKNIFDRGNNILCVKPLKKLLGKCDVTNMLKNLGSLDKSILVELLFYLK